MRYAIISDLHANHQALKAVLADIRESRIDEIICLGDVVGYGPSPAETLKLAYENVHHFILGNHDAVIAGIIPPDNFNDAARMLIEWTTERLDAKAADFFNGLPLHILGEKFCCSHGEFTNPGRFGYIVEKDEALNAFRTRSEQLLFVGHTHIPGLHVIGASGTPHWLPPTNFSLEDGKRYIVNPGSVGFPREDDSRAAYCIYDESIPDIVFKRIPFDIDASREDAKRNSMPTPERYFPATTERAKLSPARTPIDFTPLDEQSSATVENADVDLRAKVEKLEKSKKRLVLTFLLAIAVFATLSIWILLTKQDQPKPDLKVFKAKFADIPLQPKTSNFISMPDREGKVSKDHPLAEWNVALANPETQRVLVNLLPPSSKKDKETPIFKIQCSEKKPFRIFSPPVPARAGERYSASAQFKNLSIKEGTVEIAFETTFKDGTKKTILAREPKNLLNSSRWIPTSITISTKDPLSRDCQLRFVISGNILGTVLVRKCEMKKK
jgi:predicted phosphodiesterase